MLLSSLGACAAYRATTATQWVILGGMAGIYLLAMICVHALEKQYTASRASKLSS
jgi:uncharacterized phage-like protein YoqJ